jgi:predicted 3-demethylubiquinone-9 3-methyltransferase (glyoxalase superfamily)
VNELLEEIAVQKITACLWFDDQAEEAVEFYTSIFKRSRIGAISRNGDATAKASGRPKGSVLAIEFELEGQRFLALNGGPKVPFTMAVSLMVDCKTQKELDRIWTALSADPASEQCGWLKDKFGLSWQIIPAAFWKMHARKDPVRFERMMEALIPMKKLDLAALQAAYDQPTRSKPRARAAARR